MAKIALIGAGSVVFTQNLVTDIFLFPELRDSEIALMDIDAERLKVAGHIVRQVVREKGGQESQVIATLDRREAIRGARYVVNTVQVGGFEATLTDFNVPKKYGFQQTIADTTGIGGIMRCLRTMPILEGVLRDMENLAPDGWLLNYTNPMAMLVWGASRLSNVKSVGLCHSIPNTAWQLSSYMDVPWEELRYRAAGINHFAFFLELRRNGEDLYPRLREVMEDPDVRAKDPVRFEGLRRFGYFVSESSEHFSEYLPYFIKKDHPEFIDQYSIPIDEYIRRCESYNAWWESFHKDMASGGSVQVSDSLSGEFGPLIIHSIETNTPRVVYGNLANHGLIDNLPPGCAVELPCAVDGLGLTPTTVGNLPPQLAALIRTNVNVQELAVEAALTHRRDHVYQAAFLDPHASSELTLDEIAAMVDDLLAEHGDLVPPLH
ncbi:MAG TPA: alpha-glucosidase/alpha-galactosidase [Chloroflexota bacterium]|jgi:alpha-galactosidase